MESVRESTSASKESTAADEELGAVGGAVSGLSVGAADVLAAEVARLCMNGSDVNSTDSRGFTGLHLAARDGRLEDVKSLVQPI